MQTFPPKREKVFGRPGGFPHDRNARVRIETYVLAWNAAHKTERQHQGPVTAAAQRVLHALLWHFLSYRDGKCFPAYETIAAKARCARSTVAAAIKALEETGVFEWIQRIDRIRETVADLFGRRIVTRIIRKSNCYLFRDPLPCAPKSENRTGVEIPDLPLLRPEQNPALEAALNRWGMTFPRHGAA